MGLSVDRMHQLTALTPPERVAHTMGYDGEGRMNAFSSPPNSMGAPLSLAWHHNARRQLDDVTRADGSHVTASFDPATAALTGVTWPGLGVVQRASRPLTGATDYVDAPNGCRARVRYEFAGEVAPDGAILESVPGATCPVTGSVTFARNALGETTAMTVAGGTTVGFTVDQDADRLLTAAGGMTITPDAVGRVTTTSAGVVATTQSYDAWGALAGLSAAANGSAVLGFAYTPDAQGRIAEIVESGEVARTTSYAYDAAGRLWRVSRGGVVVEEYLHTGTAGGVAFTASYDVNDRRTHGTPDRRGARMWPVGGRPRRDGSHPRRQHRLARRWSAAFECFSSTSARGVRPTRR